MMQQAGMKGKLGIKGALQFRDKDGKVLSVMEFDGSVPLDRFSPAEQAQLVREYGNGSDNR